MKKILFNDKYGLTRAVVEGRKTKSRRIVPPPAFFTVTWDVRGDTLVYENDFGDFIDIRNSKYAHYKLGDVVAVAQRYQDIFDYSNCVNPYCWEDDDKPSGWTNKMFTKAELMPHRIRITDVRAERLQDISDEDCLAEGIYEDSGDDTFPPRMFYDFEGNKDDGFDTPQQAFATLIDKVSGRGTWMTNPWVLAYEFELIQ